MFLKFLSAAAAVSFLLTPLSASADPRADVAKMAKTFFAVTSFHCDVTGPGSRKMSVDFVAPDRFRTELPGGKEAVIIGSDMWMPLGGRSIKLPGIAAPVKMYLEQIRNLSLGGVIEQAYDITDNGTATLNGVRTHKYTLVSRLTTPNPRCYDKSPARFCRTCAQLNHIELGMTGHYGPTAFRIVQRARSEAAKSHR